ncbi:hypothetical protein CsSME_00015967 [Camellia sinensis var. sinensis]
MTIKKSIFDIHLKKRPMANSSDRYQSTESIHLGDRGKGLLIINTILLGKTLGNQVSLVKLKRTIRMSLNFVDPFATNQILTNRQRKQLPSPSFMQSRQLIISSSNLIGILTGLLVRLRF